ncbi:MAG TPA: GNAT family N-acetyltransferase [Polyangiaceae bacterium]|nr:GNAT family N-acetyltransferase [Polyangiaceae bacterium]
MSSEVEGDVGAVRLELAREEERSLLANLLELYIHDLSEAFCVQIGADGRFGYPRLASYWAEPGKRFPFLIRQEGRLLGFALAQRGSPLSDDPEVFDVAEFFVLRAERRSGVGARAAKLLWDHLPGRWTVRVSEANRAAVPFWTRVVKDYAGDAVTQTQRDSAAHRWQVFAFDARPSAAPSGR